MATPINTIYSWFETGDFPTQAQFQASWSSFWHKDEAIPMTNISGLSDQFGRFVLVSTFNSHLNDQNAHPYFAKKDASNLTPTNVNDWKAKLGVGDLPENIATYDYDLHDHVMMKDGTTKEATDLGKNIANSSLASVAGSGMTLGSPYIWNTATQPFSITGLPDKSADATFDRIRVQNSLGQEAMATNAYVLLKNTFGKMTAEQSLELGQLLNGGVGSAGNMSVNLISPPILQQIDSVEYILLRGTNLNLNASSKKIEIIDAATNALVYLVPDEHIQLYNDGITLIFQYNPVNLPLGTYKLRITSGVKVYVTTLLITCVQNVTNINVETVTWEVIYASPSDDLSTNTLQGRNVVIRTPLGDASPSPVIAFKSSKIFNQGEDFYIEIKVSASIESDKVDTNAELNKSYFGLGYSNVPNSLTNNSLIHYSYNFVNPFVAGSGVRFKVAEYNNSVTAKTTLVTAGASDTIVTFIKTGNLFRTIIEGTNTSSTLSNNSGYSLFGALVARVKERSFSVQIIKAYTFN